VTGVGAVPVDDGGHPAITPRPTLPPTAGACRWLLLSPLLSATAWQKDVRA